MTDIHLILPIPPTVNNYTVNKTRGGRAKTQKVKQWEANSRHLVAPFLIQYKDICSQNLTEKAKHYNFDTGKYSIHSIAKEKQLTLGGIKYLEEELTEAYSEKQRKWACAQMGKSRKNFKGKKKLSKKEAEEMCKSEVEEK